MTSERTSYKLIDIIYLIGGGTPKTSVAEYWNGDIPWLSVKDFNSDDRYVYSTEKSITQAGLENSSTKILSLDDIIISARGTVGELAMIPFPMAFNQSCYGIRGKNGIIIQPYLYYFLKNSIRLLKSQTHGSVFDTITRDTFANIEINLPPVAEQQIISDILSALDAKIAENRKINHHLEQMAQAIFKSWFVDFEPFDGVVPGDWQEGTLGDVASITSGKRPPYRQAEFSIEAEIPLLGASSIMGYTNAVLYDERILVTGRVGTHGIIQRYSRPCWASDNTLVIKSDFYEFTYQQLGRVDFHNMNRGSTQPLITQTDLKNVPILLPNETTLREFEELVGSLMERYEANILESERLAEIRDALLPRLMSGKLPVADISDAK